MSKDPYKIEMLDVAKEVGANVVITFHSKEFTFTIEQLELLRSKGFDTTIMSCVMAGLAMSGMSEEESMKFLSEADETKGGVSVAFEAPEGKGLNLKSKEENPMMDQLVQIVEDNQ